MQVQGFIFYVCCTGGLFTLNCNNTLECKKKFKKLQS